MTLLVGSWQETADRPHSQTCQTWNRKADGRGGGAVEIKRMMEVFFGRRCIKWIILAGTECASERTEETDNRHAKWIKALYVFTPEFLLVQL